VADQLVVNNGGVHGATQVQGQIALTRGVHPVRLRYLQAGGHYTLSLLWARQGEGLQPIPPDLLSPSPRGLWSVYGWRYGPYGAALLVSAIYWWWPRRPHRTDPVPRGGWFRFANSPRQSTWVLIAVGDLARVVTLLGANGIVWPDSYVFYLTAQSILRGNPAEHDPFRTFLYPAFLSVFLWFGETPFVGMLVVIAQQALGLLSTVFFFRLALKVCPPAQALLAALIFSVHSLQLFYELSVLSEALFTFTLAACLLLTERLLRMPTAAMAAGAGAMLAMLTLVRPVAQWYVAPVAGLVLVTTGQSWRRRAVLAGVVVACYAALLTPWMAVNQSQYGFWGISIGRGLGLFTRVFDVDRAPQPTTTRYPDVGRLYEQASRHGSGTANAVRNGLNYGLGYSTAQTDDAMFGYAREAVGEDPLRYAMLSARQWLIQLSQPLSGARTCPSSEGPYLCSGRVSASDLAAFPGVPPKGRPGLRRALAVYMESWYIPTAAVFLLAALGGLALVCDRSRPRLTGLLLVGTVAYFTLVPALTQWPQDRYRLPVDPILFTLATIGGATVMQAWGRGSPDRADV
jgi:hypothetical protein